MTFNDLTCGQKTYIASLYNSFMRAKKLHRYHPDCIYVEAAELHTVFGSGYRKTIENLLICKDESYVIGEEGTTKAYTFSEELKNAFLALKPHELKMQVRSSMDVVYEEKLNVKALSNVIETWALKPETVLQLIILRAQIDENGINQVWYRKTSGARGRRFAACVGLQGIPDAVRQEIIDVSYTDIDMVNAHPTFLCGIAKKLGMKSEKINGYIEDREDILKKLMNFYEVDRKAAKDLMLQTSYGSGLKYIVRKSGNQLAYTDWINDNNAVQRVIDGKTQAPTFLREYKKEMEDIGKAIVSSVDWLAESKKSLSSKVAIYVQDMEDRCLAEMEAFCAEKGIKVMALAFDGMMVEGTGHDFHECEIRINKMLMEVYGIEVELKLAKKTEMEK
jgi:hypothetical protein